MLPGRSLLVGYLWEVELGRVRSWAGSLFVGSLLVDTAVAAFVAATLVFTSAQAAGDQVPPRHALNSMAEVIFVLASAAIVLWRQWPVAFLAAEVLLSSAYLAYGYPNGPLLIMVALASCTFAYRRGTRVTLAGALPAALVVVVADLIGYARTGLTGRAGAVGQAGWVLFPALLGGLVRETRAARARAGEEAAGRRLEHERLRMARELHDIVGHGLSVISLQAGVALHVLERRPEYAESALVAIQATSREALDELRATLAITPVEAGPSYSTALGRLPAIVDQVRLAGLRVNVETVGAVRSVPPAVDHAALRVVQEALTNVLRHAGPATARVHLSYEPASLTVSVGDDGKGAAGDVGPNPLGGRGLTGLRQRISELGGTFAAGRGANGGWRVCATFPVPVGHGDPGP